MLCYKLRKLTCSDRVHARCARRLHSFPKSCFRRRQSSRCRRRLLSLQRTSTGRPPRLASLAGVVLDAPRSSPPSPGLLSRRRQLRQEVVREAQYEFVSRPELASFRYHLTAMCANMQQNLSEDVFIVYERTQVFESHRNNQNLTICAVLPGSTLYLDLVQAHLPSFLPREEDAGLLM